MAKREYRKNRLNKYKYLFFDLDQTIWDFNKNSSETLIEVFHKYGLDNFMVSRPNFISVYHTINKKLWKDFRDGLIDKGKLRTQRFILALNKFGISDISLAQQISIDYLELIPQKTSLLPYTKETVSYLKQKYSLNILTNGFQKTQLMKLRNCGLLPFFNHVITSETIGYNKPNKEIFAYALEVASATRNQSIMIGDDLDVDITGARNFGIDQIFLNPHKIIHSDKVTYEIYSLKELQSIL